jgi:large subunit ribosomal protein L5
MVPKQKVFYTENIVKKLEKQFSYRNPHQIPKLLKIKVNRGLGEASRNTKIFQSSVDELTKITGQKPKITLSKESIAGFKIRENMVTGISVTLRRERMYAFLDKLVHFVFPSIKDFRGIDVSHFDGQGNFNFGLKDQLVFPEINYEEIQHSDGFNVSIITSAKTDEEAFALLSEFGVPFSKTI